MPEPDDNPLVSVIVPVHDTADYLGACLDSLVDQTINDVGPGALEVLAIDDGSSDGSAELLDEYAARHDIFRVEHHPASGGPAAPRNRGLDLARGRYLFFLDSDDHLWTEALLRLHRAAEEWDSEVVFGRMVGAGGRSVYQRIYRTTRRRIDLTDPHLPYTLSVTKLFRRSLVEAHGLRFDPGLRIGSDQPFAAAAMARAAQISVLTDHPYYYAVMREDLSNITYSVPWRPRLAHLSEMIHQVAATLPAGEIRENVLSRHFSWELTTLVNKSWAGMDPIEKAALAEGIAIMSDAYLTAGVARRLTPRRRVLQRLVQDRRIDLVDALFAGEQQGDEPALVLRADRAFLAWPGFSELPDPWYDITDQPLLRRLKDAAHVDELRWEGSALCVSGWLRFHVADPLVLRAVLVPVRVADLRADGTVWPDPGQQIASAPVAVEPLSAAPGMGAPGRELTRFATRVDATALLRATDGPQRRWELRLRLDLAGTTYDLALTDAPDRNRGNALVRLGARFFRLVARSSPQGRLVVFRKRLPLRRVLAERLGR